MLGLGIFAVGVWAWTEKDIFNNLSSLKNVALDPAFILICVGCVTFLIGITGCVGALRENTAFLAAYTFFLLFLLIGEMCFGILVVVLKDKGWIKEQATDGLRAFIAHYREDPDQQNLIDWIQEDWLQCCGIEGPKDWDSNNYFNCSSTTVGSREACGVPFSCCKRRPQEIIKNKQCGYDVRKEENVSEKRRLLDDPANYSTLGLLQPSDRHIYERGCLRAMEDWLESHLLMVASATCSIMIIQVQWSALLKPAFVSFLFFSFCCSMNA